MQTFIVSGADRRTGVERSVTIEAADATAAEQAGNAKGLYVESVRPAPASKPTPPEIAAVSEVLNPALASRRRGVVPALGRFVYQWRVPLLVVFAVSVSTAVIWSVFFSALRVSYPGYAQSDDLEVGVFSVKNFPSDGIVTLHIRNQSFDKKYDLDFGQLRVEDDAGNRYAVKRVRGVDGEDKPKASIYPGTSFTQPVVVEKLLHKPLTVMLPKDAGIPRAVAVEVDTAFLDEYVNRASIDDVDWAAPTSIIGAGEDLRISFAMVNGKCKASIAGDGRSTRKRSYRIYLYDVGGRLIDSGYEIAPATSPGNFYLRNDGASRPAKFRVDWQSY
jgi:hypothetical protein